MKSFFGLKKKGGGKVVPFPGNHGAEEAGEPKRRKKFSLFRSRNDGDKSPVFKPVGGRALKGIAFLSTLADLDHVPKAGLIVLAGELVGVSIDRSGTGLYPGLVSQPDLVLPSGQRLHGWVAPQVLSGRLGKQAVIMADQMAEYCMNQPGDTLLVSGIIGDNESIIMIVATENKRIRLVEERILPGADAPRLSVDLDNLLDRMANRYSTARQVIASPLPEDAAKGKWDHIGDKPFRMRRLRAIGAQTTWHFNPVPFLPAIGLVLGVVGWAGAAIVPAYSEYEQRQEGFMRTASLVQEGGHYAPADVDLLTRRKAFIDESKKHGALLQAGPAYAKAVAQAVPPGARVLEMKVNVMPPKITGKDAPAQFSVVLMLPSDKAKSALDQAAPVISRLAATSGFQTRLAYNGWRDEMTVEGGKKLNWRIFTVDAIAEVDAK